MTPQTLSKLDILARILIVAGSVLILLGESIGIVPVLIGVPWLIAALFGLGRPRIEPRHRQPPQL